MKVIFMGTPDFAVPTLKALIDNGYEVCLIVTQPDKPKGRGNKLTPPPVKEIGMKYGIDIFQPEKVKNREFVDKLLSYKADLIITCAYGKILSKEALETTKYGCINVHASLLPKYRGAAPLWWVIINGEAKTGITTMFTDEGMDTGDMLLTSEFDIDDEITVGELSEKLSEMGAETLLLTLDELKNGSLKRIKQNNHEATYAPLIQKDTGYIDWGKFSREIINLIRGTNPYPGAYTFYEEQKMKIFKAKLADIPETEKDKSIPGEILSVNDDGITVKTGDGAITVEEIQIGSSKRMSVKDYIRGHRLTSTFFV